MNKYDWFFLQPVTESEMTDAFQAVENSINSICSDQGLVGIFSGMGGTPTTPINTLNVLVAAGAAYDATGQRIIVGSPYETANCAVDYLAVPTTVAGGGNEKWLSVFAQFARVQSDSRIDGNGNTIQYDDFEGHNLIVKQASEQTVGTNSMVALDPTMVLLFDVHLIYGQTAIASGDISSTRRQDVFNISGSPFSIRGGTMPDGLGSMLSDLNTHVAGSVGAHPDTAISAAGKGSGTFTLASGSVGSQLTAVVADLNTLDAGTAAIVASIGANNGIAPLGASGYISHAYLDVGVPTGIATLDSFTKIANVQLHIGESSGVAGLDSGSKVPLVNEHNAIVTSGYLAGVAVNSAGYTLSVTTTDNTQHIISQTLSITGIVSGDIVDVWFTYFGCVQCADAGSYGSLGWAVAGTPLSQTTNPFNSIFNSYGISGTPNGSSSVLHLRTTSAGTSVAVNLVYEASSSTSTIWNIYGTELTYQVTRP